VPITSAVHQAEHSPVVELVCTLAETDLRDIVDHSASERGCSGVLAGIFDSFSPDRTSGPQSLDPGPANASWGYFGSLQRQPDDGFMGTIEILQACMVYGVKGTELRLKVAALSLL